MIEIKKPIEFTIVSAVPLSSTGTHCATKVENIGESEITVIPQNRRKKINTPLDCTPNINGEIKQQLAESSIEVKAIRFASMTKVRYALSTHAKVPIPIIAKDNKGILKC